MPVQVAIIGDSVATADTLKIAEEVGKELAIRGCVLICGGREGVMEAACKGSRQENGITVGILPSRWMNEANPYCLIRIPTGMQWTRNSLVVLAADGVIVLGGKSGTLSEIAYSWIYNKPIVVVEGSGGWGEKLAGTLLDDRREKPVLRADSAKKAVDLLLEWIHKGDL